MRNNNIGYNNIGENNVGDTNVGNNNTGECNVGNNNTGRKNIGNGNVWDRNFGNGNTGLQNIGDCNSGKYNIGDYNSGHHNVGNYNSGLCNIGNYNSGDFNKIDCSNGCFNTEKQTITMFNKHTEWTYEDWIKSRAYQVLCDITTAGFEERTEWVSEHNMTEEEKREYPEYKITGGYLREKNAKELSKYYQKRYDEYYSEEDKEAIKSLPNFDAEIFKEITGINVNASENDDNNEA